MPDEEDSREPSDNPANHTLFQSELIDPISKQKKEMPEPSKGDSNQDQDAIKDLRRELHWVEKATFWTQAVLGIIGIVALVIYYRQLGEMKSATLAANGALETANESLWRDKRSWVGVSATPVPILTHFVVDGPSQGYSIAWYFLIQNFGPGVALNVVEDFETANKHALTKHLPKPVTMRRNTMESGEIPIFTEATFFSQVNRSAYRAPSWETWNNFILTGRSTS